MSTFDHCMCKNKFINLAFCTFQDTKPKQARVINITQSSGKFWEKIYEGIEQFLCRVTSVYHCKKGSCLDF